MIVAELGTNWNGNYGILDDIVFNCKNAKVDCVKFQALDNNLIQRHGELPWYEDASVTEKNVERIDTVCRHYNMEWFCTPCYPDAVEFLDPFVKKWKIRCADNQKNDIIQKCLDTGKPTFISVSRNDDVKIEDKNLHKVYCIPKYPTSFGELNFDMIKLCEGYSNHCLDPLALFRAMRYGAQYLEFHLTPNSDSFAIDNKVSFTVEQMKEFMIWLKA